MKHTILLAVFVIANAHAHKCENKQPVFQCNTENNKSLVVCGEGTKLFYRFGKSGTQPEKTLIRTIDDVDYTLWDGNGHTAAQSMTFHEGHYSYRVFSQYRRLLDGVPTQRADVDFDTVASGGVKVMKDKKVLATISCKTKKMLDNIEQYALHKPLKSTNKTSIVQSNAGEKCSNTVFYCTTTRKKTISICKTETDYIYQYGKVGKKPEIVLTRRHDDVIKTPWNGMGSSITQSLSFAYKNTVYSVFSSMERTQDAAWSGGVLVEIAGKKYVNIDCNPRSLKSSIMDEVGD